MKRVLNGTVLVMLVLLNVPMIAGTPYWVKPGVYIEYIAQRYDPYIDLVTGALPNQIHTAEIFIEVNGTLFRVFANNNTTVRFDILDENNGYLRVRATIMMENVTILSIFLNGTKYPVFWNRRDVISEKLIPSHDVGFLDCAWLEVKLNNLTLSGDYMIRRSDGAVFDMDGNYYGHTFLWINPNNLPEANETFSLLGSTNVTVWGAGTLNESAMTYYGKFGPPLISIALTMGDFKLSQRIDEKREYTLIDVSFGGPSAGIIYDPSSGIALYPATTGTAPYADFRAIGVKWAVFEDQLSGYRMIAKKNRSWKFGLVLHDTNADFGAVDEVKYTRPQTAVGYIFYITLVFLGIAVVWASLRKRR
ncbi:hypothetical protein [Thermococcus sp. MAR1]|uniref:hypothetical protein n=1 Tax=Thermococcus sp. MAR1 TaxID=1638263 RepID=UPI00143B68C8|nr:hypothetical protein [Thermococcus sp. MAR1]NJE10406.1 hypothetical protein [Thermococcus sp. MAR1]